MTKKTRLDYEYLGIFLLGIYLGLLSAFTVAFWFFVVGDITDSKDTTHCGLVLMVTTMIGQAISVWKMRDAFKTAKEMDADRTTPKC